MKEVIFYTLGIYFGVGFLFMVYEDLGVLIGKLSNNIEKKKLADKTLNDLTLGVRIMTIFAWPFILRDFLRGK